VFNVALIVSLLQLSLSGVEVHHNVVWDVQVVFVLMRSFVLQCKDFLVLVRLREAGFIG